MEESIKYQYNGHGGNKPLMSCQLELLLYKYKSNWPFVHLNHIGTVGDANHVANSSDSFHLHQPPDAIDILDIGDMDMENPDQKLVVAERFASLGGVCYHARQVHRTHLHVQIAGTYKGIYREGYIGS